MTGKHVKLVTIVAESVLADQICAAIESQGASGFTITNATGKGSRGMRVGELPGSNVRIETLVEADTADRILAILEERYFPHYAVAAWVTNVQVVRAAKYT